MGKEYLRSRFKRVRSGLGADRRTRAAEAVLRLVSAHRAWREAPLVLSYLSVGSEVDTTGLIALALSQGKTVCLPRTSRIGRELDWHRVTGLDGLVSGPLGILEPPADEATRVTLANMAGALALVPGLAFDRLGYRLGYGGGCYDAFLGSFAGASIGLTYDACLVDSLEELGCVEPHDEAVEWVVSESGWIGSV